MACALCGGPLDDHDLDRGACHDCRSSKGKVADLDIAIRASGDNPQRITDWPVIRHLLRRRFGEDRLDTELWERCTDWLRAEGGLTPNDYLAQPMSYLQSVLEHGFTLPDQESRNQWLESLHISQRELKNWSCSNSPSETGYVVEGVPVGHPLHAAVVGLQPLYGGSLPKPARGHWRKFLTLTRNDDDDAEDEAERLLEWVNGEIESPRTGEQPDGNHAEMRTAGVCGRLWMKVRHRPWSCRRLQLARPWVRTLRSRSSQSRPTNPSGPFSTARLPCATPKGATVRKRCES